MMSTMFDKEHTPSENGHLAANATILAEGGNLDTRTAEAECIDPAHNERHSTKDETKPLLPSSERQDAGDSKLFKIFKTGFLVFTWIFVGIFTGIIGASLIDLTEIAHCSYSQIGQALTGLHLAMPVGSISAGILCARFPGHLDLILGTFLSSLALSSAALPWCSQLAFMATVMVVQGMSRSVLTCCGNVMMLELWKEKSAPPLHAMHFGSSLGSFIAPLMVGPFMSPQRNSSNENGFSQGNHSGNTTIDYSSHIYIPYGIEGGYGIVCSVGFFLFYLRRRRQKRPLEMADIANNIENKTQERSLKKILSPGSCAGGDVPFGVKMTLLLFLFYCCVIGVIVTYSTYLLPVAIDGHAKISKKEATYLTSGYWGSFAAGRFLSAFIAKFVPIHVMFVVELSLTVGSAGVLAFYGLRSRVWLWVSTCAFAFVSAPVFPSGVAWANLYLDVNGPLMSVFQSGVGVGAFVAGIYGGYGLQNYGPNFPLYLNFSFAIGLIVIYVIMQICASCHGRKQSLGHAELQTDSHSVYKETTDERK